MRRRVGSRVAVVVGALVVALGAPFSVGAGSLVSVGENCAGAAVGPTVAVVVDYGDVTGVGTPPGDVTTACVPWSKDFRGLDALENAGFTIRATGQGQVCAINGYPADGCGKQTGDRKYQYWAYWKARAGDDSWSYSLTGAATEIHEDVTEGWRFVEGAGSPNDPQPRADASHDATCGSTTAPGAPDGPAVVGGGAAGGDASPGADPASPASSTGPGSSPAAGAAAVDGSPESSISDPVQATSTTEAGADDVALAVATPVSTKSNGGNILGVVIVVAVIAALGTAAFFRSRGTRPG